MARTVLSSDLGLIHPSLVAEIFACDEQGAITSDSPLVRCLIPKDGLTEQTALNWNQPFEQSGIESKVPAIAALLQTGQFGQIANAAFGGLLNTEGQTEGKTQKLLDELKGRTGITQLNSRQVFAGMPPVRYTATLLFRAWSDTVREVENPIEQLKQWGYLEKLSKESRIVGVGAAAASLDFSGTILAMFPSKIPQIIGFTYGGKNYSPMVIENISDPMAVGRDEFGRLQVELQVEIASLTALDRNMRTLMLGRTQI